MKQRRVAKNATSNDKTYICTVAMNSQTGKASRLVCTPSGKITKAAPVLKKIAPRKLNQLNSGDKEILERKMRFPFFEDPSIIPSILNKEEAKLEVKSSNRDCKTNGNALIRQNPSESQIDNSDFNFTPSDVDPTEQQLLDFENFLGFWIRDTIDDWMGFTLIEFFIEGGLPRAKFYGGTQIELRENNLADVGVALDLGFGPLMAIPATSYTTIIDTIAVEVIDEVSLRFRNTDHYGDLGMDQDTSTFRIQDKDNNIAYTQLWTDWDGTSDDRRYGELENLSRFSRLESEPQIQRRDDLTTEYDNPVNLFNYVYDSTIYLGHTEKRESINTEQFIGNEAYAELYNTLLTTGIVRTNEISQEIHLGMYVGVWRTRNSQGVTTLRLKDRNYYHFMDEITITGFTGPYSILNGIHRVSFIHQGSVGPKYKDDWMALEDQVHQIHVDVDTSAITVDYDPALHGVAKLSSLHGPVTPETEYKDLMIAIGDLFDAFGASAHTRQFAYADGNRQRLDTYAEVQNAIQSGDFAYILRRGRGRGQMQPRSLLYFNPVLRPGDRLRPIFNVNDPFGLWEEVVNAEEGSKWDYDIDIQNYLEIAYNIYFAVTGPILEDQPITSEIGAYYGSNGSQIRFTVSPIGVTPADLIDEFGTHPYNLHQLNDRNSFVFGIVKREYTDQQCDDVVAYIRIGNEFGWDAFATFELSSLVFGRNDMPRDKHISNEMGWMAEILKKLKEYSPTRYILDIRENDGGVASYPSAWASFFGDDRPGLGNVFLDIAGDPTSVQSVPDGIQTVNKSLRDNANGALRNVNATLAAKIFPESVIRGTKQQPITVVILDDVAAGSAADVFPHYFIGPSRNPKNNIHDLGCNVYMKIVGTIDGRLYNGVSLGLTPVRNPNPYTLPDGSEVSLIPFRTEAGILTRNDRHGPLVNQQEWTKPAVLVPSWYERFWQDIGIIDQVYQYPLADRKLEIPDINDNTTWRDLALESAIAL